MLLVVLLPLSKFLKICGKRNLFINLFFLLKIFIFSNALYANYGGEIVIFLMAILIEKIVGVSYFYLQCSRQLQGRPLVVSSPHIHYLTKMLSLGLTSVLSFENQIRPCWWDKPLLLLANPSSVIGWLEHFNALLLSHPLTAPEIELF